MADVGDHPMTPTPREDTMAEQEPRTCPRCGAPNTPPDPTRTWTCACGWDWTLPDVAEALAAQVRERDAQIALLTAQVEQWEREHDARADETAKEAARADELEAERDAAQQEAEGQRGMRLSCEDAAQQEVERLKQQIATLTEVLEHYMSAFGQGLEAHGIAFGRQQEEADAKARAVLQSTRPQEQP